MTSQLKLKNPLAQGVSGSSLSTSNQVDMLIISTSPSKQKPNEVHTWAYYASSSPSLPLLTSQPLPLPEAIACLP